MGMGFPETARGELMTPAATVVGEGKRSRIKHIPSGNIVRSLTNVSRLCRAHTPTFAITH
jgi:hypothetical protein